MLVKSSSLPSFSIRCLALTTLYPLLILIFLRWLFTSGFFTSQVNCFRPCVLDCSGVVLQFVLPKSILIMFCFPILLAPHSPCLFFVFLRQVFFDVHIFDMLWVCFVVACFVGWIPVFLLQCVRSRGLVVPSYDYAHTKAETQGSNQRNKQQKTDPEHVENTDVKEHLTQENKKQTRIQDTQTIYGDLAECQPDTPLKVSPYHLDK